MMYLDVASRSFRGLKDVETRVLVLVNRWTALAKIKFVEPAYFL